MISFLLKINQICKPNKNMKSMSKKKRDLMNIVRNYSTSKKKRNKEKAYLLELKHSEQVHSNIFVINIINQTIN